ncbi:hypothetical protein SAMN04488029_2475 [Reichenbachiella faecimaris]|uniref:Uncharacterized protein n=1 Tax=Reichenbachiella faecimaris TaxID=692418 RepID=A0A1W2GFD9_REIFA|nr:hypothetical protein SAMN04488029_2475 [Reichenbachiella faecimaris]
MAWGGLHETNSFNSLSATDQSRILNRNAIELTGKNLNNVTKAQKGKDPGC